MRIDYRASTGVGAVFHVILYEPEIPPNTGNIIRLCANTGARLHLIEPLGFELERRAVRRAGLDYDELASLTRHRNLEECLATLGDARVFAVETFGSTRYDEQRYVPGDAFLFGPETRGLPPEVLAWVPTQSRLHIPMRPGNRSLNLSNAVAIVTYEAWRQTGFASSG
jgi:tRNA (cytidine/uridine-2'-O-)-methyltransferase